MLPRLSRFLRGTKFRYRGFVAVVLCIFMMAFIKFHGDQEYIKTEEVHTALDYLKLSLEVTYNTSTYVLQPFGTDVCKNNGSESYLLLMYITSPENEAERNFARKNIKENRVEWEDYVKKYYYDEYKSGEVFKLLFFVGMPETEDLKERIITEWETHGDLIVDDFTEAYLHLTLKTVRMLKWVQTYCAEVKYLLKVDGDVYFHMEKLVEYLEEYKFMGADLIAGYEYNGTAADNDPNSKWYTPPAVYQGQFPNFVAGFFYVLGSRARSKLYENVYKVPPFHMEDVFLTGFVRNATELETQNIPDIHMFWPYSYNLVSSTCALDNYVAVHSLSVKKLMCWTQFTKNSFECNRLPVALYC